MKRIIFYFVVFIIVFFIYYSNINKKKYYLSIGDQLAYGINNHKVVDTNYSDNIALYIGKNLLNYVNFSNVDDYRVMDLINDINDNSIIVHKGKKYTIQNLLVKSNLIILSIGNNNINKINADYKYINELINDIDKLFKLINKFNKDKKYMLSFYNINKNPELIEYANTSLQKVCKNNKIIYVDIKKLSNYIINGIYPTNEGYLYITNQIKYLLNE